MPLRLRFPELLEERGLTPYALAARSDGRISMSVAHRLARGITRFDVSTLEALIDVLGVEVGELFTRDAPKPRKASRKASTKRKRATR